MATTIHNHMFEQSILYIIEDKNKNLEDTLGILDFYFHETFNIDKKYFLSLEKQLSESSFYLFLIIDIRFIDEEIIEFILNNNNFINIFISFDENLSYKLKEIQEIFKLNIKNYFKGEYKPVTTLNVLNETMLQLEKESILRNERSEMLHIKELTDIHNFLIEVDTNMKIITINDNLERYISEYHSVDEFIGKKLFKNNLITTNKDINIEEIWKQVLSGNYWKGSLYINLNNEKIETLSIISPKFNHKGDIEKITILQNITVTEDTKKLIKDIKKSTIDTKINIYNNQNNKLNNIVNEHLEKTEFYKKELSKYQKENIILKEHFDILKDKLTKAVKEKDKYQKDINDLVNISKSQRKITQDKIKNFSELINNIKKMALAHSKPDLEDKLKEKLHKIISDFQEEATNP